MSSWWVESPEANRMLAEERALVRAAELVADRVERGGIRRKALAKRLGITASELSQRLSGRRNLTVRSLAAMAHEMGLELVLGMKPAAAAGAKPATTTCRTSDWPQGNMGYTQSNDVSLRVIRGHAA